MPRALVVVLSALALSLSACTSWSRLTYVADGSYELARVERADGSRDVYELRIKPGGEDASLHLTSEYARTRAFLGLKVVELDRAGAERRGVEPYSGLLVTGTYPKSSAEAGGVMAGDVLLSIDGKPTVYVEHAAQAERVIVPGQKVVAAVLRGQTKTDLQLTANELKESITDPQDIELDKPPISRPYAGVVMRGIPAVWAERMFGNARQETVLASVVNGSPAWEAGFRSGDLIEALDGAAPPPLADLARIIRERGEHSQPVRLRVRRGAEHHEADIALQDYTEESQIWFPLLFRVRNGVQSDRWSVGPFGLLVSNRSSWLPDNSTREPQTENVFSALLGLIHVRSSPHDSHVRLLWFITIDT